MQAGAAFVTYVLLHFVFKTSRNLFVGKWWSQFDEPWKNDGKESSGAPIKMDFQMDPLQESHHDP